MKAIILSAGQGKRLHPHTVDRPKCLVSVGGGHTVLSWQLLQLGRAGVTDVVVVTGFGADQVDAEVRRQTGGPRIRTLFNPGFASADNLASAALAAPEMDQDFIILNGDTMITAGIVRNLCSAPAAPVTVSVAPKHQFDSDDMKAIISGGCLKAVSKTLDPADSNAESIGMIRFQGAGVGLFKDALATVSRTGDAARKYYLSAIDLLAHERAVSVYEVAQSEWTEIDVPEDLERARRYVERLTAVPAVR